MGTAPDCHLDSTLDEKKKKSMHCTPQQISSFSTLWHVEVYWLVHVPQEMC